MIDVDAITKALYGLVAARAPADLQVFDTYDQSVELQRKAVAVTHPPTIGSQAVTTRRIDDEGGVWSDRFEVVVRGSAVSWDGDMNLPKKRADVQAMLQLIDGAIEEDRSLGGTVVEASLSPNVDWYMLSDTKGTTVQADFQITVEVHQ